MRKIKILKVNPTAGSPGSIEIAGDFTQVFQGKHFRDPETGEVAAPYATGTRGFAQIRATTFDIVENERHAGRYTVYSPTGPSDVKSSTFTPGVGEKPDATKINVNEAIPADGSTSDGYVTNISTYLLDTGSELLVVPPTVNITTYPVEFMGRDSSGWGEAFAQNFMSIARNFAGSSAPSRPFVGLTWFDTADGQLRVWDGQYWDLVNRKSFGTTFQHTQGTPAVTWTIIHGLNLPAPHIGFCQFYVDRGEGPQAILPSNVEFVNGNQMRVTFSNPERGYAMVRQ